MTGGPPVGQPLKPSIIRRARRLAAKLPPRWDRRAREVGKLVLNYRGARAYGIRGPLFRILRRYSALLAAPYGDGLILVDGSDDEIGRTVFVRGEYERVYMKAALDYVRSASGRELGPVFVDVGANIGISTLDALLHFGFEQAICFEPDGRNFRLLRLNLVLNDLEDRAIAQRVALSNADGQALLERAPANFGNSRLVTGDLASGSEGPETEMVLTRRLDSLIEEGLTTPEAIGLLWIDAQGHDPYVMEGARTALRSGFPVVVEYWPKGLTLASLELFEALVEELYSTVVDLRRLCEGGGGEILAGKDIARLRGSYGGEEFTDLLLLR
jgi:FkbM family methyltransferase